MKNNVVLTVEATLTAAEAKDLTRLETIVERAEQSAWEAARALKEIWERKLYRGSGSFDAYCLERWGRGHDWGKLLVREFEIKEKISTKSRVLPKYQEQVRPLVNLDDDMQLKVWNAAVDTWTKKGRDMTGAHVSRAMELLTGKNEHCGPGEVTALQQELLSKMAPEIKEQAIQGCAAETKPKPKPSPRRQESKTASERKKEPEEDTTNPLPYFQSARQHLRDALQDVAGFGFTKEEAAVERALMVVEAKLKELR